MTSTRLARERCFSHYYFSKYPKKNHLSLFDWAQSAYCTDFVAEYIEEFSNQSASSIIESYDVVIPTDRLVDALLVAALDNKLTLNAIIFYKSKDRNSGSMPVPAEAKLFFESEEFAMRNKRSTSLHNKVVKQLDKGLARNGEQKWSCLREEYQMLLNHTTIKNCSLDGHAYWNDNGINYRCLDNIFLDYLRKRPAHLGRWSFAIKAHADGSLPS